MHGASAKDQVKSYKDWWKWRWEAETDFQGMVVSFNTN